MIQYFDSGLYIFPFYMTHVLDFPITNAEHYTLDRDLKYQDENDKWEQVDKMFWQDLDCLHILT